MKLSAISAVIVPLLSVSLFPMPSLAEHGQGSTIIKSVSVTGSFQRYGQPLWDLGEPFGAPGGPGGEHVAEYNPFGDEPIPLSSDTSCDAVLATVLDPNSSNYDMDEINIPLNEVPITVDGEGHTAQLPPIIEAAPTEQSRSLPNDPITLGDWLAADGTARIRCQSEDEATVSIWFRNLAPNGLYTMWGFMATDSHSIGALPLGGVPNAFIANRYGRGWFDHEFILKTGLSGEKREAWASPEASV